MFEEEIKAEADQGVWDEQIAMMEMVLDTWGWLGQWLRCATSTAKSRYDVLPTEPFEAGSVGFPERLIAVFVVEN